MAALQRHTSVNIYFYVEYFPELEPKSKQSVIYCHWAKDLSKLLLCYVFIKHIILEVPSFRHECTSAISPELHLVTKLNVTRKRQYFELSIHGRLIET